MKLLSPGLAIVAIGLYAIGPNGAAASATGQPVRPLPGSGGAAITVAAAHPIPCEDLLKQLRAAEAKARLNEADKAKVDDLERKGIERCNADDDKRADDFFGQALKLVTP